MGKDFLGEVALIPNSTYNYSNSSVFYSLVNYSLLNYYQTVVKTTQEWLDGFVPSFHKTENGMLSSRIGAKITKGVRNNIFGRGLVYINGRGTTEREGLEFISHEWSAKVDFDNVVKTLIGYVISLGTGLLKLNKTIDGLLWVDALRLDYFDFSVNARNQLTFVRTFIKAFQTTDNKEQSYCLVEERFFKYEYEKFVKEINGVNVEFEDKSKGKVKKPYAVYRIYKVNSTSDNNNLAQNTGKGLDYKSLPTEIKNQLKEEYSAVILDKEILLPFHEYLGCELFRNEGGDFTHPSLPFGYPMLFDCIADFMEYDMERSYAIRDLYNSKGIVGIPKALVQSSLAVPGTANNLVQKSSFKDLNIPSYEMVDGLDPDSQKPIINQFEMRAQEHETKQNAILKSIATTIGMSPRVIASYLVNGNEKTAEQTHSEDDTITEFVKTHRKDYLTGLNNIIEAVLSYKGYVDNVEVRFASDGLMNEERQLEIISKKLELGLIDIEDAVREINPDLDEEQLKEKVAKAKQQQQEKQDAERQQFDSMFDGSLNEENEFDK